MEKEVWKDIEGYVGLYRISNLGNLQSLQCRGKKTFMKSLAPDKNGYLKTSLFKNGKNENVIMHRLVAKYFVPNPDNKPEVNHKDGNKRNNCSTNLEWVTRSENQKHAYANGLQSSSRAWKGKTGEKHPSSKKVFQYDLNGRLLNTFFGTCEASRETGICQAGISFCCRGIYKTAGKFKWKYEEV